MKAFVLLISFVSFPVFATNMDGVWATDCTVDEYESSYQSLEISGETFMVEAVSFDDQTCSAPTFGWKMNGTFKVTGDSTKVAGAKEVTTSASLAKIGVLSDDMVAVMNNIQWCGKSDWKKGEYVDVSTLETSESCELETDGVNYGLFYVENGEKLFFGKSTDELDGSEPAKRPVEIDRELAYKKQ